MVACGAGEEEHEPWFSEAGGGLNGGGRGPAAAAAAAAASRLRACLAAAPHVPRAGLLRLNAATGKVDGFFFHRR